MVYTFKSCFFRHAFLDEFIEMEEKRGTDTATLKVPVKAPVRDGEIEFRLARGRQFKWCPMEKEVEELHVEYTTVHAGGEKAGVKVLWRCKLSTTAAPDEWIYLMHVDFPEGFSSMVMEVFTSGKGEKIGTIRVTRVEV
jgi:hypothetical protein